MDAIDPDEAALGALPAYFRYTDACRLVTERRFRALVETDLIVPIGHGTYRKAAVDADDDLADIVLKSGSATICSGSALVRHELSDDNPAAIDIAVPRQSWTPLTRAPVVWHQFDRATFHIGRTSLEITPGLTIGLYTPERSIIDVYRLAYREGADVGHQALRRWLRRGGQPATLLQVAGSFPRALPALRRALEVLL